VRGGRKENKRKIRVWSSGRVNGGVEQLTRIVHAYYLISIRYQVTATI
jgi:hypothetical protein